MMVAVAAATLGACTPAAEQAGFKGPVREKAKLVVQNQNWNDVAVYLVSGARRMRVGTVNSMSSGQFTIPDAYILGVSDITVQADPIGSTISYVSDPIQVFPGARINLQVANTIRLSNFSVYATR
jgi:hypothetical protein